MLNPNNNPRPGWGTVCLIIGTVALVWSALLVFTPTAHGASPYGGCDEAWQAPRSEGADWCREHGWTVHVGPHGHGIVVSPHAVPRYIWLPMCRWEDGGDNQPCTWNLGPRKQGNGKGLGFWIDREDRFHYVWRAPMPGWHAVTKRIATSLATHYPNVDWLRWRYDTRHVDGVLHLRSPNGHTRTIR